MSKKLEEELNSVVDEALKKAYAEINNRFPTALGPFNNKWDTDLETKFTTMVKDSVRMIIWLDGDLGGDLDEK